MSVDTKELIMSRLMTLLQGIPGPVGVYRDSVPGDPVIDPDTKLPKLPALALLDGKEVRIGTFGKTIAGRMPPGLYALRPEIWVVLMPREDTQNIGVADELAAYRKAIVKALIDDTDLNLGLLDSGSMEYLGFETDMQSGSSLTGQMRMDFAFNYVLDPNEL